MIYRYYRLYSLKNNKSYVGKTKLSVDERLRYHLNCLTGFLKGKSKKCGSFDILKDGIRGIDYDIEMLKEFDIETGLESRIIEQVYIDSERDINLDCCNIQNAYTSKELSLSKRKIRCQNNKTKQAAKDKIRYQANKDKISAQQKIWRQNNKETKSEQAKIYQQNNKDKISAYNKIVYQTKKNKTNFNKVLEELLLI